MIRIQKPKTFTFDGFDGIDTRKYHTDPMGSSQVTNFRIGKDGSLIKREGSRALCQLPTPIRAVWTGIYKGVFSCFMLCGNSVLEVNTVSGEHKVIGGVDSILTDAEFFCYRDNLYIVDGKNILRIDDESLSTPSGYVPLIAKDWSDNQVGQIYQPRNLLNDRGRLTYVISEQATSILRLDSFVAQVDKVIVNGVTIPTDRYTVGTYSPYINVSGLNAGDRVSVYVTYPHSAEALDTLKTATRAFVFGGINTSRPMLFGGKDPTVIFGSMYVSSNDLAESVAAYPDSDSLYFPQTHQFKVGDGTLPVTAVSRHYDRLLIFTEGGAWMADSTVSGTEEFPTMSINSSVGVSSHFGVDVLGNTPYTVCKGGIYKWTSDTDELNESNAYCISDGIASMLPEGFYKSARVFADAKRREVLFYCPELTERIWVYSEQTQKWTVFDGLSADIFFESVDSVCMLCNGLLAVFDKQSSVDYNGKAVSGIFKSNLIDIGETSMKHLSSIAMRAGRGTVICYVEPDDGAYTSSKVQFDNKNTHNYTCRRVSSKRFNYASVTLLATGGAEQSINTISLSAR